MKLSVHNDGGIAHEHSLHAQTVLVLVQFVNCRISPNYHINIQPVCGQTDIIYERERDREREREWDR